MATTTSTPATGTDTRVVLGAHDLQRTFQQGSETIRPVVDVDLELHAGEFAAIVGSSGSGKTTLLQLLGGLDRPDSGEVRIDGVDTSRLSDSELTAVRARRLGIVFQQFNLVPTLTARENVEAALMSLGMKRAARRARADELLGQVGLASRAGHVPTKLSGGEQQRVAIARALAAYPPILLADEPTASLDRESADRLIDDLATLAAEKGTTLVVVSHDPAMHARMDRIIDIVDGALVG
ncbi:MAG: ABC transporter ATP-binding protein [Thermoleophilia bacterium]|nr:ABC transporter ATP-binding protein [Thermoleophilia bacterium]